MGRIAGRGGAGRWPAPGGEPWGARSGRGDRARPPGEKLLLSRLHAAARSICQEFLGSLGSAGSSLPSAWAGSVARSGGSGEKNQPFGALMCECEVDIRGLLGQRLTSG